MRPARRGRSEVARGDDRLRAAYRACRRLNARHGKTFFLATALLPPDRRPAVHALYGFARYADDLVDRQDPGPEGAARAGRALESLGEELDAALDALPARHMVAARCEVVLALADTVRRYRLDPSHLRDFLASMRSDLTVTRYPDFEALQGYMWGSAAVIGLLMLPVLGVTGDADRAARAAADLGTAFQLTNFLRDVGEDHRRGRIYLPVQDWAGFGVTEEMFGAATSGRELRNLVRFEIDRTREYYRRAADGIDDLSPEARPCVRTAHRLYGEILDEIEAQDLDVLARRAVVGRSRRLAVGLAGLRQARAERRWHGLDARSGQLG